MAFHLIKAKTILSFFNDFFYRASVLIRLHNGFWRETFAEIGYEERVREESFPNWANGFNDDSSRFEQDAA